MADEVLIKVDHVKKKFCRDLKRSLVYGLRDIFSDFNPFSGGESQSKISAADSPLRKDEFWAVNDVSFELRRGECLGLIGHNGAGKTTLLKLLNGLFKPDHGRIEMRGSVGALIALGAGFNPVLSGRENILINGSVLGMTKKQTLSRMDEIIDFAELRESIDAPVQSYSSGMQVRLGFSIATTMKPDVLILDEVLAVGDAAFQGKCFKRIGEILSNAAVIFVSHNETQVRRICNKALLLKSGDPLFFGATAEGLRLYRNQQVGQSRSARVVKDDRITSIDLVEAPLPVEWGGDLQFEVRLQVSRPVSTGYFIVHLSRNGEYVANAEHRFERGQALLLNAGAQTLVLSIGPVHLVHGKYHLSLSLFDDSGQNTVVQVFDFFPVEVTGPMGMGSAHLMPMSLRAGPAPGHFPEVAASRASKP